MKGRIKPIVIIAGIVIVLAALFVFYVCSYPYASAESEKSNWKAYFIATERYGLELENGVKQKDSVTLDVKTAREHSIPLFQI